MNPGEYKIWCHVAVVVLASLVVAVPALAGRITISGDPNTPFIIDDPNSGYHHTGHSLDSTGKATVQLPYLLQQTTDYKLVVTKWINGKVISKFLRPGATTASLNSVEPFSVPTLARVSTPLAVADLLTEFDLSTFFASPSILSDSPFDVVGGQIQLAGVTGATVYDLSGLGYSTAQDAQNALISGVSIPLFTGSAQRIGGADTQMNPVPEPATLLLLAMGLVVLARQKKDLR